MKEYTLELFDYDRIDTEPSSVPLEIEDDPAECFHVEGLLEVEAILASHSTTRDPLEGTKLLDRIHRYFEVEWIAELEPRCWARLAADDGRFAEVGCRVALRAPGSAWRRNATMIASSSGVSTVERTPLGPIGASAVVVRLRHFCTVAGLTPKCLANALTLS